MSLAPIAPGIGRALSKAMRKLECQRILSRGPGSVAADDDQVFLLTEIFPRHEDWSRKRGDGVSHIEVRRHGEFNALGFFLVRSDGSAVDISYKVALEGRGSVLTRFAAAARSEIQPQVARWRATHPAPGEGMHCDHAVPFAELLRRWLERVDLQPEDISVSSQLVGHVDLFLDRAAATSWQRYHARHATFQWLIAAENQRKGARRDPWIEDYERAARAEKAVCV